MNVLMKRISLCFCLLVGFGFHDLGHSAQKIFLVGSLNPKEVVQIRWVVEVYGEVFRRLGYEFQYGIYPLPRLILMVNTGEADGEIQRPADYQKDHPNLIRVSEPHAVVRYTAYAVKPGIALHGWSSLKHTNYKVEYRRGISTAARELKSVVAPEHLSNITTTEQGLKKLISGRSDVFVDLAYSVTSALKQFNSASFDTSKVYQAGIMEEKPVFSYLHKKHADLVPKVAAMLKIMKQEGIIEKYRKIAFEEN